MENHTELTDLQKSIAEPLRQTDLYSFNRLKEIIQTASDAEPAPYTFIINQLTGRHFSEPASQSHWKNILANKKNMQERLGRLVSIQTAAIDYFCEHDRNKTSGIRSDLSSNSGDRDKWLDRVFDPSFFSERLHDELMRAKRYNNALSAILLDVDDLSGINERYSFSEGDRLLNLIVKIIHKSIRTVDIISRYSGDKFLILLPSTNKREAGELAERIRQNIAKRTRRATGSGEGVTATLAVGQSEKDESAQSFALRLNTLLETGKSKQRNMVYSS